VVLKRLQDGRYQVQRESDGKPFGPPMTEEQATKFLQKLRQSIKAHGGRSGASSRGRTSNAG
jgi:hypothetical protein